MRPEININCLGEFEIDGLPAQPRGPKQIALLAYLASNLGKPCPRSKLASIFWRDRYDEQARQSLRQALSSLGKIFQSCPEGLHIDRDAVTLSPAKISVDIIDAEAAIADGDLELAANKFLRGEFLESLDSKDLGLSDWLAIERAKWSDLAQQVIFGRAEQNFQDANLAAAEELTGWLLRRDPLDEQALRLMMKTKAATGSVSGAVKLYHGFKETLKTELGVEPSRETIDCYHELQGTSVPKSALLDRPAVAVLPFLNVGGDPEQDYFVDGLTEDIITELSYWRTFPVIARNSTFVYKGQAIDPRKVADELGAGFILEGSVRRSGSRIRVAAHLIDAKSSHQVWADRFDREISEIFDLQDELTRSIAAVVEPALIQAEQRRVKSLGTRDVSAWDYYLRGMDILHRFEIEGNAEARSMFERALEIDPNYAKPYIGISLAHLTRVSLGWAEEADDHDGAVAAAVEAASRALELDDNDSSAHAYLGMGYMWSGLHDQAVAEVRQAVEYNPSDAWAHVMLGNALDVSGEPEQAIPHIEIGIKLNPLEPRRHYAMTLLAGAFLNARLYDEALAVLQRALSRRTEYPLTHLFKAICLVYMDRLEEARESLLDCDRLESGFANAFVRWRAYKKDSDNEHMTDALHRLGVPIELTEQKT